MTWNSKHSLSERLAIKAEQAMRNGDRSAAEELYRDAARAETAALEELPPESERTRGITAVSAVALWYKGVDYGKASSVAHLALAAGDLPTFAQRQLRELLSLLWTVETASSIGIKFVPGDVLVSVKGGEVVYGGAPIDLIVQKVEGIQAIMFRTVEMLLRLPFRRRGAPSPDVQSMFRPWLFQAPASSYQFAVRVQQPAQMHLWERERPQIERITETFFSVLRASANDPPMLRLIVEDQDYRGAFLNLSRNLAPTGKRFDRLDIRDASSPSETVASFAAETRQRLNVAVKSTKPQLKPTEVQDTVIGILRAVHLDDDWLEVVPDEPVGLDRRRDHIKIAEAGEVLDDVIGPMVNRRVRVSVVRRGQKHIYRDIELDE